MTEKYFASLTTLNIWFSQLQQEEILTHSEYCGQDNDDKVHYLRVQDLRSALILDISIILMISQYFTADLYR